MFEVGHFYDVNLVFDAVKRDQIHVAHVGTCRWSFPENSQFTGIWHVGNSWSATDNIFKQHRW